MDLHLLSSMRPASSPALKPIPEPRIAQAETSQNAHASPMKEVSRSRRMIRLTSANRVRPSKRTVRSLQFGLQADNEAEVERRDSFLDVNNILHRSSSHYKNYLSGTTAQSTDQIEPPQQQQAEPELATDTSVNLASTSRDNAATQGSQPRIRRIAREAAQNLFCLPVCGCNMEGVTKKERRGELPSSWMPCAAAKEDAESKKNPTCSVRKSSMRQKLCEKLSPRSASKRGLISEFAGLNKLPSTSCNLPTVDITSYELPTYIHLPSNVTPIWKRDMQLTETSLQPQEELSELDSNNDNSSSYVTTLEWPLVSVSNEQIVCSIPITPRASDLPDSGAPTLVKGKKEEQREDEKRENKEQQNEKDDEQEDSYTRQENKQENDRDGHANDEREDEYNDNEVASTSTTNSKEDALMDSWQRTFKAFPISDNEDKDAKLLRAAIENFGVLTLPVPRNITVSAELTERRRMYLTVINLINTRKELNRLLPIWADTFRIVVDTHENDALPPDWLLACHTAKLCFDMRRLIRRFKRWNYKIGESRNLLEDLDWDLYDPEALAQAQLFDLVVLENELQTMERLQNERLAGSPHEKGNSAMKKELASPVHDTSDFRLEGRSPRANATWHVPMKEVIIPLTEQAEKQISLPFSGESPMHRPNPATLQLSTLKKVQNQARPTSNSVTPRQTSLSALPGLRKAHVQKRPNIPENWFNIQNHSHMQNEVRLGTRFKHPSTIPAPHVVPKDNSIRERKGLFIKETFKAPSPNRPPPAKAISFSKATPPGNQSRASNTSIVSRPTPRNVPVQPTALTQQITDAGSSTSRPRKPPVPSRFITREITHPASRMLTQSTLTAQMPTNFGARQISTCRTSIPIRGISRNIPGSSVAASKTLSSSTLRILEPSLGLPTPAMSSNSQIEATPQPINPTTHFVAQSSIPQLLLNGRSSLTGGDSPFSSFSRRRLATMARRLKEEEELMEAAMESEDTHQ